MNYWLFKSEPDEYSIDHLKTDKKCLWEGVRNYQARNIMRDECQKGDIILYYHSSTKETGIYGLAIINQTGIADPSQFDKNSKYYDPKATKEEPRWICVEVKYKKKSAKLAWCKRRLSRWRLSLSLSYPRSYRTWGVTSAAHLVSRVMDVKGVPA